MLSVIMLNVIMLNAMGPVMFIDDFFSVFLKRVSDVSTPSVTKRF